MERLLRQLKNWKQLKKMKLFQNCDSSAACYLEGRKLVNEALTSGKNLIWTCEPGNGKVQRRK